jgi:hypothetical protein
MLQLQLILMEHKCRKLLPGKSLTQAPAEEFSGLGRGCGCPVLIELVCRETMAGRRCECCLWGWQPPGEIAVGSL